MIDHGVLAKFEADVAAFRSGAIDAERFASLRLLHGIFTQRQEGYYVLRTKLPGGRLRPAQLTALAEVVEEYCREGHAEVYLTTRQDIQFHYLQLDDTPAVLRHLVRYGITTREASGNTVRNITACPLAGHCPREHVDVNRHLEAVARHFLDHPLTRQLPRKFKISFSGCEADCAQGMISDLAVIATQREGQQGFRLLAFGGLGARPYAAVELAPFVTEADLIPAVEAVLMLHHRHSDRSNRARSRIKFLRDRFTLEQLLEMYQEEFRRSRATSQFAVRGQWREPTGAVPCRQGSVRSVVPTHQPGRVAVPVDVRLGKLGTRQLRGLAELLQALGLAEVRVTVEKNLLIPGVPEEALAALHEGLARLGLVVARPGGDVVSCPGATLCPLAITHAQPLASRINGGSSDLQIRVNGCQNGCAQSDTGDIGLYGKAKRHCGALIPSYVLQLGGDGTAGGALAEDGPVVPARRTPEAVQRLHDAYVGERLAEETFRAWVVRSGSGYFDTLLADLSTVTPEQVPELQRDLGVNEAFRLSKRGIGECGGGQEDPLLLLEAELLYQRNSRNAFLLEGNVEEARSCIDAAIIATVNAVARKLGGEGEVNDPRGCPALLQRRLELPTGLADELESIVVTPTPGEDELVALAARMEQWTVQVLAVEGKG
ncbi:MAG TPA: nitrite/sulfite reductase [Gammaproteobacteria bacterium]